MNFLSRPQRSANIPDSKRNLRVRGLITLLSTGLLVGAAYAERPATFWTTASGDFFDPGNWSLGSPGISLDAKIDNGGVVQINTESDQTVPYVYLGSAQNTSGTLEITTGGVANFTSMVVGALNATGTLNISGGGRLNSFGGAIGSDYLGRGVTTVDGTGSLWRITGSEMVIGGNGKGALRVQNNGSFSVANGTGRIQLASHPLAEGNLLIGTGGIAGTVNASEIYNGEGPANVIFNHTNSSYVFAPKFTGLKTVNGFLNVRHDGPGTTILTAPESNLAGTITVAAGTLIVNGNIKGSFKDVLMDDQVVQEKTIGQTEVLAGGTLGGTGFIEGKTTVQGTLSPGMGVGVLKFGGDLSLESTGTVTFELGGDLRGVEFDGVDVAGKLIYGGTLKIVLLDGFDLEAGDSFDLFNGFTSYEGMFANIVISSGEFAGSFDAQTGVLSVANVPEPSTFGLAAVGALTFAFGRRNRIQRYSNN